MIVENNVNDEEDSSIFQLYHQYVESCYFRLEIEKTFIDIMISDITNLHSFERSYPSLEKLYQETLNLWKDYESLLQDTSAEK